ncbi:dihydroorotase [uncultured Umboniibacter sp.]|uniref:dihydroorotase n=1 Tax=uncultured Umboniibacter sp. TaxID=1798917 RepID=UPI00260A856E|nr:dihydroorotase [uncultured Umboniibacter sp.]
MELTITRPDDWHLHFRDHEALALTVPDSARYMARAIVMPNLTPPVVNAEQAQAYFARIIDATPAHNHFKPLMVLYLTNATTVQDIIDAKDSGVVVAAKLYPAGATTNSDSGVTDIKAMYPVFEEMAKQGLRLLVHGEVTHADIDIFDRESEFLKTYLADIVATFPTLKVVLEHITTEESVNFVEQGPDNLAATITAHHLLYNRNDMLAGGIRPHLYCLPILKRNTHQRALLRAATSGNPKFFLGTDSAPHAKGAKEAACGCAGSYTSFAAIELYAMAFEREGALDKLEAFASHFGPDYYGMPRNSDTITLTKRSWTAPASLHFGDSELVPLMANEEIEWSVS